MCAQRRGALPPLLEPLVPEQSMAWTPNKEPALPVQPWEAPTLVQVSVTIPDDPWTYHVVPSGCAFRAVTLGPTC